MATLLHTTVRNYKVQGGTSEVGCGRRLWLSQHQPVVHNFVQVPRIVTNMKGNPIVFFNFKHSIVCMKYQVIRSPRHHRLFFDILYHSQSRLKFSNGLYKMKIVK